MPLYDHDHKLIYYVHIYESDYDFVVGTGQLVFNGWEMSLRCQKAAEAGLSAAGPTESSVGPPMMWFLCCGQ